MSSRKWWVIWRERVVFGFMDINWAVLGKDKEASTGFAMIEASRVTGTCKIVRRWRKILQFEANPTHIPAEPATRLHLSAFYPKFSLFSPSFSAPTSPSCPRLPFFIPPHHNIAYLPFSFPSPIIPHSFHSISIYIGGSFTHHAIFIIKLL